MRAVAGCPEIGRPGQGHAVDPGAGTSGASLKTASEASKRMKALMGELDVGRAKKLLTDAILDDELYSALATDVTKFQEGGKNWRIIQGWMVANAIESMEEDRE